MLATTSFASLFTFARATAAWDFNSAGALIETASGSIRTGYDPSTLAVKGWLIEQAATNKIRNPRLEGSAAGTPGTMPTYTSFYNGGLTGLTRSVIGSGTEFGMSYVDVRVTGTPSASGTLTIYLEANNYVAAISGQTWTGSAYCRLVGGTASGTTGVRQHLEENASGVWQAGTYPTAVPLTSSLTRVTVTRTLSDPDTTHIQTNLSVLVSGTALDFTIRFYAPQLEQLSVPTSPVFPPVGTPGDSTRNADALTIGGANFTSIFGAGAPRGFLILDLTINQNAPSGINQMFAVLDDGTSSNRIRLYNSQGGASVFGSITVGGSSTFGTSAGSPTTGTPFRAGILWGSGAIKYNFNGGALTTVSGALPSGLTTLRLGLESGGTAALNGYIRAVYAGAHLPSDAQFQAACALGANIEGSIRV